MRVPDARRGVVLLTVLWSIALLSALAVAATTTFRGFAGVIAVNRDKLQAEALLTSGLELAAGLARMSRDTPLTDFRTTVTLPSGTVSVRLYDHGGRIDIGLAPPALLAALFRAAGVGSQQADTLADDVVAWRDRIIPPRPAAQPRQLGGSQFDPFRDGAFSDPADLAQVPGITPGLVQAIAPMMTVYGNMTINPLSAPAEVIAALPGVGRPELALFLETRRRFPVDTVQLISLLGAAKEYVQPAPQSVLTVQMDSQLQSGVGAAADAVIVLLQGDQEPYRVMVWNALPSGVRTRP